MQVGFAGLGRMGIHMARNLIATGHNVTVWNRSQGKAEALSRETGCAVAVSPADLATKADVIVTMLADDRASEMVHFNDDGFFSINMPRTYVEMGTISPSHINALLRRAPEGVKIIDAPVSGSIDAAKEGALMVMAGCTIEDTEAVSSIFGAIGKEIFNLDRTGDGAIMKLAVNSLIHAMNQSIAEALTLVEAAGIRLDVAFDIIEGSAACAPMYKYRRPQYLEESANKVTFTVALARKDMEVTVDLANRLGVPMPQGHVNLEKLRGAELEGFADRDMASIFKYIRENRK